MGKCYKSKMWYDYNWSHLCRFVFTFAQFATVPCVCTFIKRELMEEIYEIFSILNKYS